MKKLAILLLMVLPQVGFSLSIASPILITLKEAESYGIDVTRTVGDEKTVIYLRADDSSSCPVVSVQLFEKLMTVGERSRALSKYGDYYTASFGNTQEYDEIQFLFTCSEWSELWSGKQLLLVITGNEA